MKLRSWFLVSVLASLAMPPAARAEGGEPQAEGEAAPPPVEDPLAQKHYDDGQAAAKRGDWQTAYTSYRAALAVKEHYLILAALGDTAVHLEKFSDAVGYLSLYLQKAPPTAPDRAKAQRDLADAKKQVATLTITAPPGADVFVDRVLVGKAPLEREVLVDPGRREIEVRSGNDSGKHVLDIEKGAVKNLTLKFGDAVGLPPTATAPAPTVPVAAGPRREVWISGAAVAAGAAVAGAVLLGVSAGNAATEDSLRKDLLAASKVNICNSPAPDPRCREAKDAASARDTTGNAGAWLLIGGGVAGAATVLYYVAARLTADPRVQAAAIVTPAGGAGTVSFRW